MTDEEKLLLRRKWKYQNKWRTFGNVIGKIEGFGILDFRKDGVLILTDGITEFNYTLVDRTLDIFLTATPKNILRIRIGELTSDKMIIAVSGKRGDEQDDRFSKEIVELYYAPMREN